MGGLLRDEITLKVGSGSQLMKFSVVSLVVDLQPMASFQVSLGGVGRSAQGMQLGVITDLRFQGHHLQMKALFIGYFA